MLCYDFWRTLVFFVMLMKKNVRVVWCLILVFRQNKHHIQNLESEMMLMENRQPESILLSIMMLIKKWVYRYSLPLKMKVENQILSICMLYRDIVMFWSLRVAWDMCVLSIRAMLFLKTRIFYITNFHNYNLRSIDIKIMLWHLSYMCGTP